MAGNRDTSAATHFGRQMRKERLAHGWSLGEFAQRLGYDAGHLSRIENGKRPPTEALAQACDRVFPERHGWFTDWYEESRTWAEVPPGFRSWFEIESRAASLRAWAPSVVHGLLQAEDYAAALLRTYPGVTDEVAASRLNARMERQRGVLLRGSPPMVTFVVDEMALYRCVGSAETMAGQMRQLAAVASMPLVTVQVLPAVAHPATASEFIVADSAAYAEHVAGGYVFTDAETVSALGVRFDSLRAESYRASESAAMFERMAVLWAARGASPPTQTPAEAVAWRRPALPE
jgi:transcriptional regulator with XRE-family HTH domain